MKKTPLYTSHLQKKARILDFHGCYMPIQYDGILVEHRRTRSSASLFDVSHMGEIYFEGKDARSNLEKLTCNNVSKLKVGQVQYSAMLYENGTFVDDLTLYRLGENKYQMCINAANIDKDFEWIQQNIQGDVLCENRSNEIGQIAIQGPSSNDFIQKFISFPLKKIAYYWFAKINLFDREVIIARMGYTGEDGFEIFCKTEDTLYIWDHLIKQGESFEILPAGLGARDTLRLEVGYPLYGSDISDQYTPLQAGLTWILNFKQSFIGKSALQKETKKDVDIQLICFQLTVKGVPRKDYSIQNTENKKIGIVTSGTSSPTLKQGIGMGYVSSNYATLNTNIVITNGKKKYPAIVVKKPFVKNPL